MLDSENIQEELESRIGERIDKVRDAWPKLVLGLLLFTVMFFTYRHYIYGLLRLMVQPATGNNEPIDVNSWLTFPVLLKFFLINGWPFALLAFFDKDWSSANAAKVAFPAFAIASANAIHHFGLHQCPRILVLSAPFLAVAAISHALGAWRHPAKPIRFDD